MVVNYKKCVIETCENWDDPRFYDVYINDKKTGELIDCDFARSDNENDLINEAKKIVDGY